MRHNFSSKIRVLAFERAGGQCEAVGERYGLPPGSRCPRRIALDHFHADHYPRGAHDPHPDTKSLSNCVATCPECNQYANNKVDTPREAKIKRVVYSHALHEARMQRKAGIDIPDPKRPRPRKHPPKPIRSRGFKKGVKRPIPQRPPQKGQP